MFNNEHMLQPKIKKNKLHIQIHKRIINTKDWLKLMANKTMRHPN